MSWSHINSWTLDTCEKSTNWNSIDFVGRGPSGKSIGHEQCTAKAAQTEDCGARALKLLERRPAGLWMAKWLYNLRSPCCGEVIFIHLHGVLFSWPRFIGHEPNEHVTSVINLRKAM